MKNIKESEVLAWPASQCLELETRQEQALAKLCCGMRVIFLVLKGRFGNAGSSEF